MLVLVAEGYQDLSTARYRSWNRRDQMRHAGLEMIMWVGWNPNIWHGTSGATGLVQRLPYTEADTENFERFKKECLRVGYDLDDLLYEHHRLPRGAEMDPELCRQYARAINWADFLTCSTPELATELRARWPDKAVHVLPNVTGRLITRAATAAVLPPRKSRRVTIGYTSATLAHQDDFELVQPVLDWIMTEYPHVDLVLVGSLNSETEFIRKWGDRVTMWPFVSYDSLPFLIHGLIDINLVPLIDIPFNRCKSLVKWLEAAVVGVPTVCSRIGRYKNLPEGAAYSAVNLDEWRFYLTRLVENRGLRRTIGENARKHALETYTYQNTHPLHFLKET